MTSPAEGWQAVFHGDYSTSGLGLNGGLAGQNGLSTMARSIHVFPGSTPQLTRVAICGETLDERLPLAQAENTPPSPNPNFRNQGYVAVFNGAGVLQWSHFFIGRDPINNMSAVTDISIRVEVGAADQRTS